MRETAPQHSTVGQDAILSHGERAAARKVLLLNNVPSPYLTPLFERLLRESGWNLQVCYVSSWNSSVGWHEHQVANYQSEGQCVLDRRLPILSRYFPLLAAALALLEYLFVMRPDYLVIYGYTRIPQLTALLWCWLARKPFALAGDATYYADGATGLRKRLKVWWLGLLARQAAAIIVVGKASRMFWEAYGAAPAKIYAAPFAVDNDFFLNASQRQQPAAQAFRKQKGWEGKTVFLYAGRLIKRKNVDLFIHAIRQAAKDAVAVIVGDGEERAALAALAGGDARIYFAGNASQQELAFYYALSDVLVLPASEEPWGLVVNEAMACGLAVIAHWQCGAAVDLVAEDNGTLLRSFTVEELAAAMRSITADADKLQALKQRSREKIAPWSFEQAAASIRRAVELSSASRVPQPKAVLAGERSKRAL
jgi:glycosyltransferase involved in cell wall biosynthesis